MGRMAAPLNVLKYRMCSKQKKEIKKQEISQTNTNIIKLISLKAHDTELWLFSFKLC